MGKPKYTYFDFAGWWKGEVPRVLMFMGGVDFEDVRVNSQKDDWPSMKKNYTFGQLPALEVNGKMVTQGIALIRYAARLAGLMPKDDLEIAQVDEILNLVDEFTGKFGEAFFARTEEDLSAQRKDFKETAVPEFLRNVEKLLGDRKFLVGDKLSVADVTLWKTVELLNKGREELPPNLAKSSPAVMRIFNAVDSHQKIVEWKKKNANLYFKPKFTYFKTAPWWRVEAPRMAMFIGGIDFDDVRIEGEKWPTVKNNYTFGQLPALEVDGKMITQGIALLKYAGRISGLIPKDVFQEAQVDEVLNVLNEYTAKLNYAFFAAKDEAKQKDVIENQTPALLKDLEKLLGDKKTFFVGDKLTIADLAVWKQMDMFAKGSEAPIKFPAVPSSKFPAGLLRNKAAVEANEKVIEWKKKFPEYYN